MNKDFVRFHDTEIKERKFHRFKKITFLEDAGVDNIVISDIVSPREQNCKCFIGDMNDVYKFKPFSKILAKVGA